MNLLNFLKALAAGIFVFGSVAGAVGAVSQNNPGGGRPGVVAAPELSGSAGATSAVVLLGAAAIVASRMRKRARG